MGEIGKDYSFEVERIDKPHSDRGITVIKHRVFFELYDQDWEDVAEKWALMFDEAEPSDGPQIGLGNQSPLIKISLAGSKVRPKIFRVTGEMEPVYNAERVKEGE